MSTDTGADAQLPGYVRVNHTAQHHVSALRIVASQLSHTSEIASHHTQDQSQRHAPHGTEITLRSADWRALQVLRAYFRPSRPSYETASEGCLPPREAPRQLTETMRGRLEAALVQANW